MSNDDVLLVLGISNDSAGDSCPQNNIHLSKSVDYTLTASPPPPKVSNFCLKADEQIKT
jgi:hypothetical protein